MVDRGRPVASCPEWHGHGTTGAERRLASGGDGTSSDRPVRPVQDDPSLVGKGRRPTAGCWGEGFEPSPRLLRRPRSERWTAGELRFSIADRDRSCPPMTSGSRCRTDPARTRPQSCGAYSDDASAGGIYITGRGVGVAADDLPLAVPAA
jgi:hypothetical protein